MGNLTSLQYLYLNTNQLSDLPNLSAITNLEGLVISYNQFTFSDLENSELNFSAISTVHYSPQALLKITSQTDNGDGTSTLSFTTDGTGDAYQWFNGSSLIENATTSTLVVNNSNMGIYYCKVTNPAYPDLTLETKVVAMNTTFSHGVFEDEYNILVELYNNTSGNSWISKYNWLSNNDVDEWYGVEVSGGHVTSINLYSNNLAGTIPPEIGTLASLQYLYLNSNQLSGAIPTEIGNLNSLKYLYLNSNQLSGAIPSEIGSLTNLVGLYLYNNQLSDLPNLSASLSLGWLNTSSNHLTFEDIEPNLSISYFNYSPQARVGSVQHYTPNDGDNLNISVSVGGANNTYQWYRDGASIPGATGATYSISSYSSVADAGVYVCRIQNSMATELTLESYCIYVGVDVPTYTVDVSASPVSSGTVSGGGTYEDGQTATVSATPSIGYWFASWTSNGTVVSTSSAYSFVVTGNTSLVANFKLKTYAVSATPSPAGSGTVTGAGTYSHGASVTLVATPITGYRFASWTSNGTEVSTSSAYTFVVTGDTSLVANFEDITGIIEDGLKESISIYPNPTNRLITVSGEGADMKSIAVYDFMGRLRGRYNVNTDEAIIDFTGYPSGVYLVVVKTNMGIFTKKIVRE
jgi:Leucine-rich repeat (LRR) protein